MATTDKPDPAGAAPKFRVGQRVRDRFTGHTGTIKCGSIIHGDHYQVRMDMGFDTLLIAAELDHADECTQITKDSPMPTPDPTPPTAAELATLSPEERRLWDWAHEDVIQPEAFLAKIDVIMRDLMRLRLAASPRPFADAPRDGFAVLSAEVLSWQSATFPHRTPHSITEHLRREAEELAKEPGDAEEMADVGLLLIAAADASGVDLVAAIRAKLEKNKLRKWGVPDSHGVVSHTEESP